MGEVAERVGAGAASGTLAFLFTDIAGSTRLWEEQPTAMTAALARHDALLLDAIDGAGGRVVKTTGDGVMAVFPGVAQAVAASVASQASLAQAPWPDTGPLRVRMGLHAGEAERRGDDFFGPTVNRTARIMAAGHGGQVLLSAAAAALVADGLPEGASLRDLGEYRLKDIGRPERVYQLEHPRLASGFPPLVTLDHAAGRLPPETTTFIGRQAERADLARRLEDPGVRLLTLTGPGGTGKTALALRVARDLADRYRDGVSFADCSGARDTHEALLAIARALGVAESPERPLADELADRLRDRQMLIVVDNFEQVTEAAPAIAGLLVACSGVRMLVTSREPLHVRAEQVVAVEPLGLPPAGRGPIDPAVLQGYEAVQLFVDRARMVRDDFALTPDNVDAVADICRRLDGLPLAIELAAARLRLFSPETLRGRLTGRLELLRSSARDLPARHQTLRATIEWSYQLLEPGEQRLFELLAVFADADLGAVEAVAAGARGLEDVDVIDALGSLLEKSLVRQLERPDDEPRFAMLETIHEFATDRLEAEGRGREARHAHAAHYTDLATRLRGALDGGDRDRAMHELVTEAPNLRLALRAWVAEGDIAQLTRLADSLLLLNEARGWYHDTVELTTSLLAVLAEAPSSPELAAREVALRTRLARAILATEGFTPEAERAYAQALERFEQAGGETRQHYSVLRGLANLYLLRTDFASAHGLGERILEMGEAEGDPAMQIDGRLVVGSTLTFTGEVRGGLAHIDAAIALFDVVPAGRIGAKVGNDPRVACLTSSAFMLWLLGSPDTAAERTAAAIELAHRIDHPYTSAYALFHAGLLHLWRREPAAVLDRAIRLLDIADEHELRIWSAVGSCLMGAAQARLGQVEAGLASVRSGMAGYQGLVAPPIFWPMLLFLDAGASWAAGRFADGIGPIDAALEMLGPGSNVMLLPEIELLRGDILEGVEAGGMAAAGSATLTWRTALESARRIDLPMSELRALTRLVRSAGPAERPELVGALERAIAAFTEGFATDDLREAREALAAG